MREDENWLGIEGKVCVVTGAIGGMGTEICREFARNGANAALLDVFGDKTRAAAKTLSEEFGIEAHGYEMDATSEQSVQASVDAVMRDFGRVDVLVNTAGILRYGPIEDLPLSEWQRTIDVNLTGYFLTSQRFGREMMKAGRGGSIVHISSIMSVFPETFSGAYSAAKAGVNALSETLAVEWGRFGIRSNCILPCFVKTPLTAGYYEDHEVESEREALTALRRIGTSSDIANTVAFLASPRSGDITGEELRADGGFSHMMGDLVPKQGGRRGYALDWMEQRDIPSWSKANGIDVPGDADR